MQAVSKLQAWLYGRNIIFPNPESYLRLVTVYLMEYSEDWSVTNAYLSEDSLNSLNEQAA